MSSLNNLYISQSYQGLLHFSTNSTASANLELIEDGLGNSLGLYLNNNGDLKTTTLVSSSTIQANNFIVKNKIEITGSIDINGSVTASNALITNDLNVAGTLFANKVVTLIESSSIIFSSGSNILGDESSDIQTLIGSTIMSGSSTTIGNSTITGSQTITGSLNLIGTGNLATTASNTFIGNQIFSGSVRGGVNTLTITSNTASMNCSLGNFFTLTLPTASATLINPSNILPGETISLRITQPASGTAGTVVFPTNVKFPALVPYVASTGNNSVDIITFISFDSSSLFAAATKNLI
jgi:hypothetical protein